MKILDRISGPEDLKGLSRADLDELARELRAFIIEHISPVGGHLASSLGVVELTIALHAVFDSPEDKIVWDVGHQCYPHKILTGRRDRFPTIRRKGGLSGFPKRNESPHDAFGTGHASTSISAALGMAVGRDLRLRRNKVIAVIGDGSMSAGMAFEGLNHAGHVKRDLVVVLNDNEMSISNNVGALSSYLSRILTGDFYSKVRKDIRDLLKSVPMGESVSKFAKRAEEYAKGLLSDGMLFEELGFNYVGPIDGHNLEHLVTAFRNIAKYDKPVLVHVITKKGKGFVPAECSPTRFHGVGPFNPCDGAAIAPAIPPHPSYTSVFADALVALAERDPRIVAITAAMPEGTGLDRFAARFPERFFDVGIAEEHAVTFAAGLACEGLKPVVAVYSTFMQRAFDQVIHDVAIQNLPVVFAMDRAGLVGADGATHHGSFDFSFMRQIPSMTVLAPSDEVELKSALLTALCAGGPASLRYPRGNGSGLPLDREPTLWEVGKGRIVHGSGTPGDLVVFSAGTILAEVLAALEEFGSEGVTVFDARFVKPLDAGAILLLARCARGILTVEENALPGGFGSAVVELLADSGVALPMVRRVGLPDAFIGHGTQSEVRREAGCDRVAILEALKSLPKAG